MSDSKEQIAVKVGKEFKQLSEQGKKRFVTGTLEALMTMKRRGLKKMFQGLFTRGRPSKKTLENINQLVLCFLYSVKAEYRPRWAYLIYKALKRPIPDGLQDKIQASEELRYIHAGVPPETYHKLDQAIREYNVDSWSELFNHLLTEKNL